MNPSQDLCNRAQAARRGGWSGDVGPKVPGAHRTEVQLSPDLPPDCPIQLHTRTPIVQRLGKADQGGARALDPVTLLTGLGNRISGLAQWHGLQLDPDPAALRAEAVAMGALAQDMTTPLPVSRGGGKHALRVHQGHVGTLRYPPAGPILRLLLRPGIATHIGADTSTGAGRCVLALEPPVNAD